MVELVKIEALPNGAHENLVCDEPAAIEPGWAVVPVNSDTLPNFPFGNFDVEDVDGVPHMVADSWEPLPIPDSTGEDIPEDIPTGDTEVWDELDAAYQEGVNTAYDS